MREEQLGLTPARLRGIRESRGNLLIFVDDDNFLDQDFLENALRISEERPYIGAFSGQCCPEFDELPPEWTRRYWGNLVIRELKRDLWSNLPRLAETMPCGAGLCLRRRVALYYQSKQASANFQLDRQGTSLVSGGDNDMAACACDLDLGVGLFVDLKLVHKVPKQRLTLEYLAKLAEGIQYSSTILDAERGITPSNPSLIGHVASIARRLLLSREDRIIASAVNRGRMRALQTLNQYAMES